MNRKLFFRKSHIPGTVKSQTGFPVSIWQESSEPAPNQNLLFPFTETVVWSISTSQMHVLKRK